MKKKYLKRLAEDDFQLNRTFEMLMKSNSFNDSDIVEFTAHLYNSWSNANSEGYIDEQYNSFDEWFKDYVISVSHDIIIKAKNDDEEFANNYAQLDDVKKQALLDKLNEYLVSRSFEIEQALKDAG